MKDFLLQNWARLSLAQQFSLASLLVLIVGMTAVGSYVSQRIKSGVVQETAATTAIYIDSVVAPLTQELAQAPRLSLESIAALDQLVKDSSMRREIVSFKIWGPQGELVYSTAPENIGKVFPLSEEAERAWRGAVSSGLSDLDEESHAAERNYDRLLETYSPVRSARTNEIIAVAEFYQRVDDLKAELSSAILHSWIFLGVAFLVMFALLSGIVGRGSDTIARQQGDLRGQLAKVRQLLQDNEALSRRVRRAATASATSHERVLRQVGAELHDGPLQGLGLASLRLDSALAKASEGTENRRNHEAGLPEIAGELEQVQSCLQQALEEIRSISAGLGLPELEAMDLREAVTRAARFHEQRTGSKVALELEGLPEEVPLPVKITFYRVVQQALNNAYLHAGGCGQRVRAFGGDQEIGIAVEDDGPGFEAERIMSGIGGQHLGLVGMRERVESLGGRFTVDSAPRAGTRVVAWLPLLAAEAAHG